MKWSVLHWPPVPRSVVQSLARFSTLPIPLRMFMLMMREIGERALCGKRWSFASMFLSPCDDSPPYSLYPNPILYEKGFGYVFVYRRFAFVPATNAQVGCLSNRTVCVSRWRGFATTSSEKRLLRAINKQRQGIIITVVPCLLLCIPYIARFGSIAAYVRTWPVRTYAGKRAGSCI